MSVEYLTFTAHEDIIDNVLEERGVMKLIGQLLVRSLERGIDLYQKL